MRKYYIIFALLLGILSSCNTTQTFIVRGVPGTIISKHNKQLAVIDQTGQAKITLDRKKQSDAYTVFAAGLDLKREYGYDHFLLAQAPGSNIQVPFALDYKDHNRERWINLNHFLAPVLSIYGVIGGILGGAMHSTPVLLSSIGVGLISIPLYSSFFREPIDFNYDYLKVQSTNNDLIR